MSKVLESKKYVGPKNIWKDFFKDKKHGGHRYSSEDFLAMEAREKLFHLDGGRTLLDFGCGAAELLTYYAPQYEQLVGVDFSESMLEEASKRIKKKKLENIDLILADHETLWENLDYSFDRITAAGVIQFLTFQEIDKFIFEASKHLNKGGKLVFFDIMDSRLYPLWKIGLFSQNVDGFKILCKTGFEFRTIISAILKNRPRDILGYSHNPNKIKKIANKNGFEMICVQSMYYEYKYHAIIFRT
ncbi:methyltransferase domain-containing protein [Methanosarcina sp. Z-7115]|uniref:Methyltransferase domain-containing protein n=1 Tax=Methanosarcina baikalica TaxID=3073890 RepID=A0ABU2D1E3_9EURY|nr:methyltransferase domain-containing protein [Methanosarcina sp. Z-7115]MDR7665811.1 methyltransferase domain-containing protein [Methanosarcina sp. Z-7115]